MCPRGATRTRRAPAGPANIRSAWRGGRRRWRGVRCGRRERLADWPKVSIRCAERLDRRYSPLPVPPTCRQLGGPDSGADAESRQVIRPCQTQPSAGRRRSRHEAERSRDEVLRHSSTAADLRGVEREPPHAVGREARSASSGNTAMRPSIARTTAHARSSRRTTRCGKVDVESVSADIEGQPHTVVASGSSAASRSRLRSAVGSGCESRWAPPGVCRPFELENTAALMEPLRSRVEQLSSARAGLSTGGSIEVPISAHAGRCVGASLAPRGACVAAHHVDLDARGRSKRRRSVQLEATAKSVALRPKW